MNRSINIAERVGRRLKALREEQGITQEMMAARLTAEWKEVSPKTLSAWETGRTPFPLLAFEPVASALRVEPSYLGVRLGLCGEPSPREIFLAEGADIMAELANEPPDLAASILRSMRTAMEIAKTARAEYLPRAN